MKLSEISNFLELDISKDIEICELSTLKEAKECSLSFFHDKRYLKDLQTTKAGAVILDKKYENYLPKGVIGLFTNEPYKKMAQATKLFAYTPSAKTYEPILKEGAQICSSVKCGKNVEIGANSVIMSGVYLGDNVKIGDNCVIYPNVTIYHNCKIGNSCIIHSGTVIGSDGFGFVSKDKSNIKFYQIGNVIIEDNVEIGSNCSIDRATLNSTIIRKNAKLDNLIQIGHNCDIGEFSIIVSQTGLSGSTKLGKGVVLGGQCGSAGHLSIGDGAMFAARSGITKSLEGNKIYGGFPAIEIRLWRKMQAALLKLVKKDDK
jgi:UDP-3-O-[3-hydroxymyristoyl] glucosamine N-acyltransferase